MFQLFMLITSILIELARLSLKVSLFRILRQREYHSCVHMSGYCAVDGGT